MKKYSIKNVISIIIICYHYNIIITKHFINIFHHLLLYGVFVEKEGFSTKVLYLFSEECLP